MPFVLQKSTLKIKLLKVIQVLGSKQKKERAFIEKQMNWIVVQFSDHVSIAKIN